MDDHSLRSILITLRASAPEGDVEPVVRVARYDFGDGAVLNEILEIVRVDEVAPLVRAWIRSFLDQGDPGTRQ